MVNKIRQSEPMCCMADHFTVFAIQDPFAHIHLFIRYGNGETFDLLDMKKLAIPQESVLGPLLNIFNIADISRAFTKHLANGYLYADDVQAYVHGPPAEQFFLAELIDALSQDFHLCVSSNRCSPNSSKTQLSWFGTRQQLLKLDFTS